MSLTVKVNSPNVKYGSEFIESKYSYESSSILTQPDGSISITPFSIEMEVKTSVKIPKVGLMMVGLGGNNGSTLAGLLLANKHNFKWATKNGEQSSNFLGSVSQVGAIPIGLNGEGQEIFVPIKNMIPLLDPLDLVIDGWDISSLNLGDALERAAVFEVELQKKLRPLLQKIIPRKAAFFQEFVAANQADRADNVLIGTKSELLLKLREDIRDFKSEHNLDKIIVLWVGNTERFSEIVPGLNDTWENLKKSVEKNEDEISPSTLYALAAILEDCGYINGSPQNSLVPGVIELASSRKVFICGDDLKTGQTKLKSVLVEYLVGAGLKPKSIVSYNHLGNNDGKNLSAPHTFRSKEITKQGVADDMVGMNPILFPEGSKGPDHLIVIKYVPSVGDSKRAMDEYVSEIGMGGLNTLVIHNTCEDSLLAAPIMLDLVLFMELFQRIEFNIKEHGSNKIEKIELDMGTVLGYWLKAPLTSLTNSLTRQRGTVENLIRAALSLPPSSHLHINVNKSGGKNKGLSNGGCEKLPNGLNGAV